MNTLTIDFSKLGTMNTARLLDAIKYESYRDETQIRTDWESDPDRTIKSQMLQLADELHNIVEQCKEIEKFNRFRLKFGKIPTQQELENL